MTHHHGPDEAVQFTQEFWDDRYRSAGRLWSGQPNAQLVAQAAGSPPPGSSPRGSIPATGRSSSPPASGGPRPTWTASP